ncbi:MAG: DUF3892 domain-containing protein [Candidatus Paceibacterota bacterium]
MLEITCIKKDSGNHENPHTAISELGWVNVNTNQRGKSARIEMYNFVVQGGRAYVSDAYGNKAYLITAISPLGTKYVKTVPDSTQTDNLLKLPKCWG